MTNDEKGRVMPEHLIAIAERAKEYKSVKAFEESLREEDMLQYHGTPVDFSGDPNTKSMNYGILGNGFYLAKQTALAKKHAQERGVVKKYVLDPKAKFFDAGKGHAEYLKLWERISGKSATFTSMTEVHDMIREHLEREGYAGIQTAKQSIVFDSKAITELPKDFFKQVKNVAKDHSADLELKQPQFVVRHNVRFRSVRGYVKEFERNEAQRMHKRKDNVQVYHTILSFSNKDKEQVNDKILADMAKKYIELRGKDNLYVITAHYDKDHIHMHCAMSGVKLNGLSSRISRSEFASIKVALDAYQKEKYPQLVHSLPRHGKAKQIEAREEYKNIKRNERFIDKTLLMQVLDDAYSKATSQEHFLSQLSTLGHEPYYRSGKLTGVKYNGDRKFRLNRLGFDEQKLFALGVQKIKDEQTLQELSELRKGRNSRHRDLIQQTLPLEDAIKGMNEDEKRKELQKAVNSRTANETRHTVPDTASLNDRDTRALRELQDIRESRGRGMERDIDNDRVDNTDNHDSRDASEDNDSRNDQPDDDKNTDHGMDDSDNDDDQH